MSRTDAYGGATRALKRHSRASFLFGNQIPPKIITGCFYLPPGYGIQNASSLATTVNRLYYVPFPVYQTSTFAGAWTRNNAATDTGELIRIMSFKDNGAIGGPGTLAKDFGEITLTGAAAVRTLSSSWTATAGMYWLGIWFNSATDMHPMGPGPIVSAVGISSGVVMSHMIGSFAAPTNLAASWTQAHYVDTAYGAAPATAVAPTATEAAAPGTDSIPVVGLKG